MPNVGVFREQAEALAALVESAPLDAEQSKDMDLQITLGELFTLVVYGQLILEQAEIVGLDGDVLDELFGVLVRDFSAGAVALHGKANATEAQQEQALAAVRRPAADAERFARVWQQVESLSGAYAMGEA